MMTYDGTFKSAISDFAGLFCRTVCRGFFPTFECSPTFNGVPVAATFLLYQAQSVFSKEFPGLEIAAVFEVKPQRRYGFISRDDVEKESSSRVKTAGEVAGNTDTRLQDAGEQLDEYNYREYGGLFPFNKFFPNYCEVMVPIYERFSDLEEARLGEAGIKKPMVGRMKIVGECSAGCAKVRLQNMVLYKLNSEIVWEWDRPKVKMRDSPRVGAA